MTTTARTGNGWAVIRSASDPRLHAWVIPGANRRLTTQADAGGFLLVYVASVFNDKIERLDDTHAHEAVDEASWCFRPIAGTSVYSEHAAARAADLNWNKHPSGVAISRTFTRAQIASIRYLVRWLNRLAASTVIEWGGEWPSHPGSTAKTDGMHFQVHKGHLVWLVRILAKNTRGRRILKANPWVTSRVLTTVHP